jgi:endonuclease YncB( thermonuclease family)
MSRKIAAMALLCFGLAATGQSAAPLFDPEHPPRAGDEGVFYGPLVRVKDGDSLVAKVQGVAMEIRLGDIDTPELDQAYGRTAKRSVHLNAELVKRGAAWFYAEFARDEALYGVEQEEAE